MSKKLLVALLVLTVIASTLLFPSPTLASSGNRWTGTFDGTEPTYNPNYCGSSAAYDVVGPVTPSTSGSYYYRDISIDYDIDMQIDVYMNSFDPLNPTINLVGSGDDWTTFVLNSGTPYYFVISQLCGGTPVGTWDFVLVGPSALGGNNVPNLFRGTISGNEPTFTSPYCGGAVNGYVILGPVTPLVSGSYYYRDISIDYAVDMQIDIYINSFDPLDPNTNHVYVGDDWSSFALSAGTPYYFIVSPLCGSTSTGTWEFVIPGPGLLSLSVPMTVPNTGEIMITTSSAQPAYASPAGDIIRDASGNEIWLPHDADNNGFDTYIVTDTVEVDGQFWYAIFLGNENWGWVPASHVTVTR